MAYMTNGRPSRRRGMGDYDAVSDLSWMYYPPPYGFANPDPRALKPPAEFIAPAKMMGLGCGCGGSCGGCGEPGLSGMFSSGFDMSGWGVGEWSVASAAVIVLASGLLGTAHAGARKRR